LETASRADRRSCILPRRITTELAGLALAARALNSRRAAHEVSGATDRLLRARLSSAIFLVHLIQQLLHFFLQRLRQCRDCFLLPASPHDRNWFAQANDHATGAAHSGICRAQ